METLKWISFAIMLILASVSLVNLFIIVVKLVTNNVAKISSCDTDFSVVVLCLAGVFAGLYLIFKNGIHSDGWLISITFLLGLIPFFMRYIREKKEK